jgi:carbamoyltransferase
VTHPRQPALWKLPEAWRPAEPVFAFHEDSNANAVLITPAGEVYAVAEERLSRKRFEAGFPKRSLAWLEAASGVRLTDAPVLVFGNRTHFLPRLLGDRFPSFQHDLFGVSHKLMLLYHHLCFKLPPFASAMAAFNGALLRLRHGKPAVLFDHHFAHAASAYYTSDFDDAVAVTADNFGDGYAAKVYDCESGELRFLRGVSALSSPGQFYGEVAQLAGIHSLLAGKLTGMAASGDPRPGAAPMQRLFDLTADTHGFTRTFSLNRSPSQPDFQALQALTKPDLAAAAQQRLEDVLTAFVEHAVRETGRRRVVLAGGSFANVRLNQRVRELPEVDAVWIHPAMTDQGIAMGAALAHIAAGKNLRPFRLTNVQLGPAPTEADMIAALAHFDLPHERPADIAAAAADRLAAGKVIARFDGPLEYGPRALGNRSVLYEIQDATVTDWLNKKLRRASYMPFAPMTLAEHAARCYHDTEGSPDAGRFMTVSYHATDWMKENCPGVVHIDGTVRPQILHAADNPGMHRLLVAYEKRTGMPSLLNTSFNMHHEPIVGTAHDACRAFIEADLDHLVLGPFLVSCREK